ncbi:MAG: nucleotidyltransferase family protein [Betaproteobacteria bacterium]
MTTILLAAGSATRFGSQKLLARLDDGRYVVEAAAQNLLAAGEEVIAVSSGDAALTRVLESSGCRVVINPRSVEGMGTSIAAGVCARPGAPYWLVALADMPFIRPATIALISAAVSHERRIVVPVTGGQRGHPVAFGATYGEELMALAGDTGARSVVAAHAGAVTLLDVGDAGTLDDIDTPADLARLRESHKTKREDPL